MQLHDKSTADSPSCLRLGQLQVEFCCVFWAEKTTNGMEIWGFGGENATLVNWCV